MSTKELLQLSLAVHVVMDLAVLCVMTLRRALKVFPYLTWLLIADFLLASASITLLFHRRALNLDVAHAYPLYFCVNWVLSGVMLILRVLVVYDVFAEAMRPMSGLHQAGKVVFRWVAVVSTLVAFALLAGPEVFSSLQVLTSLFSRLQQGVSVLTLCLLVFVCFTARPLGLTFRSHIFGVSLGLGIAASVELVQSAWLVTKGAYSVYSPIYLVSSFGICFSLSVWCAYFAAPEPKRKMILLPTTSPFFFWNRISEILGDAPGQVAVAGFSPEMLAPAEIEMLTSATANEPAVDASEAIASFRPEGKRRPEFGAIPRPSVAL